MAYEEGESLESWLNKATHPTNRQEDWEYIIGFCDQVNRELEGPQIAVPLLLHKICSQEWEALQALTVLEACMKNCGTRFHREVGRYRYLNELVKLVSPMYAGTSTPDKVKKRIIDMLCSWRVAFPNETKINDAYTALKKQGLVTHEPELPVDKTLIPSPPTRPKHPVFDNEDMGKLLAELLRSKNPEDLQEANRLIKNMVKEDEVRVQKVTKRMHTLEEVNINVKLLTEMLSHYDKDNSSDSDREIIKELYERCDKLRRAAFKMATEAEDNDTSLGDILQASDDLSRVINSYRKIVEGQVVNGDGDEPQSSAPSTETTDTLVDLGGLDAQSSPRPTPPPSQTCLYVPDASISAIPVLPPPPKRAAGSLSSQSSSPSHPSTDKTSTVLSLLDDELLSLALNDPPTSVSSHTKPNLGETSSQWTSLQAPTAGLDMFGSVACSGPAVPTVEPAATQSPQNLQNLMGFTDQQRLSSQMTAAGSIFGIPAAPAPTFMPVQSAHPAASLFHSTMPSSPALSRTQSQAVAPGSPVFRSLSPCHPPLQSSPDRSADISLSNVHVPLEAIKPSKVLPVTAYDKDGVRVLINFASDSPPVRPDVLVMVVSMLNTAPMPVNNVVLQAAVPKSMKVKLQPPSGTELAPFNPILPPASITQIMLLANPAKEKVRLRYKLSFTLGERLCNEVGEVNQFPPPETWGQL
ncbi:ADP-ribosylation factor-binding protein GGA3 [Oryzias melastigma]|uniref:ADP-ribosylation factor-binding protein GGA3 n=1 Tax=Oryzias melastigma TaxID=30732 RepID=A0A834BWY6_ORYME|nr:ADP-ribosylation factor-binding protein GGA3 [Oryzias melastigma]